MLFFDVVASKNVGIGAKTLLIEATGQLGGMGTTGMIPAWCPFSDGEKIIYRGLAEKVFRAAKKGVPHEPADKLDWVSINPEQLMTVYDDMVCSSGAIFWFLIERVGCFSPACKNEGTEVAAKSMPLFLMKSRRFIFVGFIVLLCVVVNVIF